MRVSTVTVISCLFLVSLSITSVSAKDCDCERHKAGASGTGTCSLTETESRCSISYSGSSSSASSSQYFLILSDVVDQFNVRISAHETFQLLSNPSQVDQNNFRDLILLAVASTKPEKNGAIVFLEQIGIKRFEAEGSAPKWTELLNEFKRSGCIDYKTPEMRFLLISESSKYNGGCQK